MPKVREVGEPDYRNKADFGKVPAYLSEIKREIAEEKEFIATMLAGASAADPGPRVRPLLAWVMAGLLLGAANLMGFRLS